MLRFVLLVALAMVPISVYARNFQLTNPSEFIESARWGSLDDVCDWFCSDDDWDYFFRFFNDESIAPRIFRDEALLQPRIFCEVCKKKTTSSTAGTKPTSSSSTSLTTTGAPSATSASGPTSATSGGASTTSAASTSAAGDSTSAATTAASEAPSSAAPGS